MKFYIASRLKHKDKVRALTKKLEEREHACTHKWIDGKSLKPYSENLDESQAVADEQVKAVKSCDVFILLYPDEDGTGMYVEFGIALAEKKKILVVGEFEKPMFLFHSEVNHVDSAEELLELI